MSRTRRFVPGRRTRRALSFLLLAALSVAAVLTDAARRRDAHRSRLSADAAIVDATGLPDLALSSSARWLRHPSQAEPGAPVSDLPASLDVDPAGALIGPPREVLEVGAVQIRRRTP